jgi:membrane protein
MIPSLKTKLSSMASDIEKHEIFMMSGSLAYTTALALAPFIVILLSASSFLGAGLRDKMVEEITSAMGEKAGAAVMEIVKNASDRPTLSSISGIVGFIVLVFSASAIFTQLRQAFDKINDYQIPTNRSGAWAFMKDKFFSFGLVFGFIFLSIVSLMVSTAFSAIMPGGEGFIWQLVSVVVNFTLFSVLFTFIFRYIPSERLDWRRCLISGLVSATFYLIGKSLIGLYLGRAGLESAYGAAGSLVVFLAWVYYTGLTILVSCEFSNNVVMKAKPKTELKRWFPMFR